MFLFYFFFIISVLYFSSGSVVFFDVDSDVVVTACGTNRILVAHNLTSDRGYATHHYSIFVSIDVCSLICSSRFFFVCLVALKERVLVRNLNSVNESVGCCSNSKVKVAEKCFMKLPH